MKSFLTRIFLFSFLLFLITTNPLEAATEQRIALVIGNSAYSSGPLKNPVNDATDIAATLQRLGFSVIIKKNASQRVMEESIREFGNKLKRGGVGLFYYAGHGLQVSGVNYLIPIAAKINQESDVKYEAIDANKVLDEMANANNGLNVVILDACRDNPFTRSFRDATRGLAIVSSAPVGTFISYSTGPGNVARDGEGRNSPYAGALSKYMKEPGLTIEQVFKKVRAKLDKETGNKQVPWELSSLRGEFYFVSGSSKMATDISTSGKMITDTDESKPSATDALDEEQRKVELEKQRLEKEEALLIEKKALEEKRQKIEQEKAALEAKKATTLAIGNRPRIIVETLAMGKRPTATPANEIKRDGRFIAYDNGTVLDTSTNLMWAARDNGSDVNWQSAKSYCENYRGGGYTDWRMPTQDELAGLYDEAKAYKPNCGYGVHLTELIRLTCTDAWASETSRGLVQAFNFYARVLGSFVTWYGEGKRALPVRSVK